MTDEQQASIAELLNRCPEIRWDRFVETIEELQVYGWIGRPDGRSDFVLVTIRLADLGVGFMTSSAFWTKQISLRLCGTASDHQDCERVEDRFGDKVFNTISIR